MAITLASKRLVGILNTGDKESSTDGSRRFGGPAHPKTRHLYPSVREIDQEGMRRDLGRRETLDRQG